MTFLGTVVSANEVSTNHIDKSFAISVVSSDNYLDANNSNILVTPELLEDVRNKVETLSEDVRREEANLEKLNEAIASANQSITSVNKEISKFDYVTPDSLKKSKEDNEEASVVFNETTLANTNPLLIMSKIILPKLRKWKVMACYHQ